MVERSVLTIDGELIKCSDLAEVAKQADALRSGRSGHYARVGSNPTFGIMARLSIGNWAFFFPFH